MTWTKKHDEFALTCNLSESQQLILRDALRKCRNEPTEIELDLRVTNKWIAKVRPKGGYHRKTLSTAVAALDEKTIGMFVILKRYSPWIYRVLVRPLDFVEKIQRAKCESEPKLPTGKPMYSGNHKKAVYIQQQQNISKLDTLFRHVGLHYDPDALNRIWRLSGKSLDTVTKAIELLLHRHSTQADKISNPQGWIINCLKKGWAMGFDLYYQAELPYFKTGEAIANFVASAINTPAPAT